MSDEENKTLESVSIVNLRRYQRCALRIWALFPTDPLPDDDPAHFMIERLESILDHKLLVPNGYVFDAKSEAAAILIDEELLGRRGTPVMDEVEK